MNYYRVNPLWLQHDIFSKLTREYRGKGGSRAGLLRDVKQTNMSLTPNEFIKISPTPFSLNPLGLQKSNTNARCCCSQMTTLERQQGQKRMANLIQEAERVIGQCPTSWEEETETTPERSLNVQENLQHLVAPRKLKERPGCSPSSPTSGYFFPLKDLLNSSCPNLFLFILTRSNKGKKKKAMQ